MRIPHGLLLGAVALLGAATVVGMVLLWPAGREAPEPVEPEQATRTVDGTILDVTSLGRAEVGLLPDAEVVVLEVRLEADGEVVAFEMIDDTGAMFAEGQRVRLQQVEGPEGEVSYLVSDFRRDASLAVLAALFLTAVLAFGRWQGLRALLGLALTFVILLVFVLPAILDGRSPVSVALVGAVAIMLVTLYLAHGLSRKTTAAVVGTALALGVTGLLAAAFVAFTHLTGFTSEEARLANLEVGGLSLRGLLLAGIIIGGLGVLDDVTMSQSSTVFELRRANPDAGFSALLRGALNVGRDHVAATVNTLFLAYAGAALPLLILFVVGSEGIGTVVTSEIVAVEVVRTLVGSIGLIAAVPLTTALAAGLAVDTAPGRSGSRQAAHGHGAHGQATPAGTTDAARADDGRGADDRRGADDAGAEDDPEWVERLRAAYRLPGERPD